MVCNVNLLQSFLLILLNKYYLQVHLKNCTYKVLNPKMIDYPDDHLFHSDKVILSILILTNASYGCFVSIE